MALTSLESISEKVNQKNQIDLENILSVSGSSAIAKNEYNVTVVDNTNPATSLLFKGLTKDKYDETELKKAVNVVVKEINSITLEEQKALFEEYKNKRREKIYKCEIFMKWRVCNNLCFYL